MSGGGFYGRDVAHVHATGHVVDLGWGSGIWERALASGTFAFAARGAS